MLKNNNELEELKSLNKNLGTKTRRALIIRNIYTKEGAQEYFKFYVDKKGVLRCGNDFVNYKECERQAPLGPKMLTLIAHWIGIGLNKRIY